MSAGCESLERLSLGAYVLGALDPAERARFEAHLDVCALCREELTGLAGLPGLLSRVTAEDVLAEDAPPPPALAERLIERLRAARRARRRRFAAFAASAATVAAVTLTLVLATGGGAGPGTRPDVLRASNLRTGVTATMALRPAEWGTAVRVRLTGVKAGTRCRLVAVSRTGSREVAGTWRATYEGSADVRTATAIPRAELASLNVVAGGQRLLQVPVG